MEAESSQALAISSISARIQAIAQLEVAPEPALGELDAIRRELALVPAGERGSAYAECILAAAGQYYYLGRSSRAIPMLEAALQVARWLGAVPLVRRSLTLLGLTLADARRDLPRALECLEEALEQARSLGDRVGEVVACVNIGVVLITLGKVGSGRAYFERTLGALQEVAGAGKTLTRIDVALVLNNIAYSYQMQGDMASALEWSERGLAQLGDARSDDGVQVWTARVSAIGLQCSSLVRLGRVAEASKLAKLLDGAPSGNPRMEKSALATRGTVLIGQGRVDEGLAALAAAKEAARSLGVRYQHDALHSLADGFELARRPQQAIDVLKELSIQLKAAQGSILQAAEESRTDEFSEYIEAWRRTLTASAAQDRLARRNELEESAARAELAHDATGDHTIRVGALAVAIAKRIGAEASILEHIEPAARMHDLGMGSVPVRIKQKPGPLSRREMDLVRTHCEAGEDLIREHLRDDSLAIYWSVARSHHERWDGSGYPDGTAAEQIPQAARIVAVADAYDSLTHERPWRKAMPPHDAKLYMVAERGGQFDPVAVDALLAVVDDLTSGRDDLDQALLRLAAPSAFADAHRKMGELMRS